MTTVLDFLIRFVPNVVAIVVFSYGIYFRRHRDWESAVLFMLFNLFLFPFLAMQITFGSEIGFVLFALLAMIRVRSETFSKREIAYFFGAIALAITNALLAAEIPLLILANSIVLSTAYIVDHPALWPRKAKRTKKLSIQVNNLDYALISNPPALIAEMGRRTRLPVSEVKVRKLDLNSGNIDMLVTYIVGDLPAAKAPVPQRPVQSTLEPVTSAKP